MLDPRCPRCPRPVARDDEVRRARGDGERVGRVGLQLHRVGAGGGGGAHRLQRALEAAVVVGRQLGHDVGRPPRAERAGARVLASVRALMPERDAVDHRLFSSAIERCLAQALSEEALA